MLSHLSRNMGLLCSRNRHYNEQDTEENAQAAEIERRIVQETEAEKHIQKLLLLGAGESGKSTIFKQIKLLFQTGFDEAELKSYIPVIHANVYQTIKVLHDGSKELAQNDKEFSKYVLSSENQEIGEKLSDIGSRLDYPRLTRERAQDIEALWNDAAIQETYARGNELQVPDCAHYFMENLQRLSDANYIPSKEDVLYARVRTTGVVEIQFSPVGENKKSGEVYRLFDVGGQRNERRKWIHLFEGVTAVIFCAAISEYDQTLFEDEQKNRMMETKELFEWVLKQECFEKTSFMLFLNKFDIFEKKVLEEMVKENKLIFTFDATKKARFGVLPRYAKDELLMRWFELPNCFIFHNANAWEEGDEVVLITCRLENPDLDMVSGSVKEKLENFSNELYEMRFNLKSGLATQKKLSESAVDFPRVNECYTGRKQQYVYGTTLDSIAKVTGIAKFDLHAKPETGKTKIEVGGNVQGLYDLGPGRFGSEAIFVPRVTGTTSEEDDGYLILFVHDENTGKSAVNVVDAKTMSSEPVAVVELPHRVPYGFHAFFVTEEQLQEQERL